MARYKIGVAHNGRMNALARGNEPTLGAHHLSHGLGDHVTGHAVPGNIARDGKGKAVHGIAVHNGMTRRQQSLQGMGHANAVAPDANPQSPLSKEPGRKTFEAPRATPGMRSRTSPHDPELGRAILATALTNK